MSCEAFEALAWIVSFIDEHPAWAAEHFGDEHSAEHEWLQHARAIVERDDAMGLLRQLRDSYIADAGEPEDGSDAAALLFEIGEALAQHAEVG